MAITDDDDNDDEDNDNDSGGDACSNNNNDAKQKGSSSNTNDVPLFLARAPNYPVCPGLKGFPGNGTFGATIRKSQATQDGCHFSPCL